MQRFQAGASFENVSIWQPLVGSATPAGRLHGAGSATPAKRGDHACCDCRLAGWVRGCRLVGRLGCARRRGTSRPCCLSARRRSSGRRTGNACSRQMITGSRHGNKFATRGARNATRLQHGCVFVLSEIFILRKQRSGRNPLPCHGVLAASRARLRRQRKSRWHRVPAGDGDKSLGGIACPVGDGVAEYMCGFEKAARHIKRAKRPRKTNKNRRENRERPMGR